MVCPAVWVICIGFKLNLIYHHRPLTEEACISRSKTNTPSSLGLQLVASWTSSGRIRPMESTPNKVSQRRARSRDERRISRSNFTRSQAKNSRVHLSFEGQFPLRHINESQLFLCFTISSFIVGRGSITCKKGLCRSQWSFFFSLYIPFSLTGNK